MEASLKRLSRIALVIAVMTLSSSGLSSQETGIPDLLSEGQSEAHPDTPGRVTETSTASSHASYRTLDAFGNLVLEETPRADGTLIVERILNDAAGAEIGRAWHLTEPEFNRYLDRLGLAEGVQSPLRTRTTESGWRITYPWGSVVSERSPRRAQVTAEILGQRMKVAVTRNRDGVVQTTDDWGGERTDVHHGMPAYRNSHGVQQIEGILKSADTWGTIAEVFTDAEGNPREVRYGDRLLVRYHYDVEALTHGGPDAWSTVWLELIDLLTEATVLDSRSLPYSARPLFRLMTSGEVHVESSVEGKLFSVVPHPSSGPYALLPIDGGEMWRRVTVGGSDIFVFRTTVDYRADRLRVNFTMPDFTIEVPRGRSAEESMKLVFPVGFDLPLADLESATEAERRSVQPEPERVLRGLSSESGQSQEGDGDDVYQIGYVERIDVVGQQWQIGRVDWFYEWIGEHRRGRPPRVRPARGSRRQRAMENRINWALNEARQRVDRRTCRDLFAADEARANPMGYLPGFQRDPATILRTSRYVIGGAYCDGEIPAYSQGAAPVGTRAVVHLCQPFFGRRTFPAGGSLRMSRGEVLVHEARHATGAVHTADDASIEAFNSAIRANC